MPSHDPYKDPAFYDLVEEQMGCPAGSRCMIAKDPREAVVELDRENLTLSGRYYSLPPRSIPVSPHPCRLNANELAQPTCRRR